MRRHEIKQGRGGLCAQAYISLVEGLLIENTSDLVCIINEEAEIQYANASYERVLGYEPEELVGKSVFHFMNPAQHEVARSRLNGRVQGDPSLDSSSSYEYEVRSKQGDYHILCGTSVYVNHHLVCVSRDVTSEKRLQQALRVSEAQYRALVEGTREIIAVVNYEGVFLFMNTMAAGHLGGCAEDYVGKTQWEIFPKDIADRQMRSIREVIDSGNGTSVASLTQVNGQMRWFDTHIEPISGYATDGSQCALVVSRDIHEIREAHEELRQYREKMIRAEHMASMGTLSAMLAHELNQPLTVIRLDVEHALAQCPDELADMKESLSDSVKEVENISKIISSFRRFAKRSHESHVEAVCVAAVVGELLGLFRHATQQSRLKITLESLDELPPVASSSKDINQLFFALIENTLQAAHGKPGCELTIYGLLKGDFVELRFSDTCGGVLLEHEPRLFEPFFTTKPDGMGTGLGLCVVEQIVKRCGGYIHVKNQVGVGITVTMGLPISE